MSFFKGEKINQCYELGQERNMLCGKITESEIKSPLYHYSRLENEK